MPGVDADKVRVGENVALGVADGVDTDSVVDGVIVVVADTDSD